MSQTITLVLPDDVYEPLARVAQQEGRSPEAVGAQYIADAVQKNAETDSFEKFIGAFDSGIPDWAEKHDEYLGEALLKEISRPENG